MSSHSNSIFDFMLSRSFWLHPLTLLLSAFAITTTAGIALWNRFEDRLFEPGAFELTEQQIQVNPVPDWVTADVRQAAFRESRLSDRNLRDHDLVDHVADAFAVLPWVREVIRVEKHNQAVSVQLQYRQPVGIVEVRKRELIPVDGEGVILETRSFNPDRLQDYLRISVPSAINGPVRAGSPWNDMRIRGAAAIAHLWNEDWKPLQFYRVVNYSYPTSNPAELDDYQIWTRPPHNTPIIWGRAPGQERTGEASAENKVAALCAFVAQNRSLDDLPKGMGWDVRDGTVRQVNLSTAHRRLLESLR